MMRYWYAWVQHPTRFTYATPPNSLPGQGLEETMLWLETYIPTVGQQVLGGQWWPMALVPESVVLARAGDWPDAEFIPLYGRKDEMVALIIRTEDDTRE